MSEDADSVATRLVNLTFNEGSILFRDDVDGAPFATLPTGETFPLGGKKFSGWLAKAYFIRTKKSPASGAFADAIRVLEGSATSNGRVLPVFVRVATVGPRVYLDLARDDGEALVISEDGWEVRTLSVDEPFRFIRRKGTQPLPNPVRGGSLEDLLPQVINVKRDTESLMHLIAWAVAALRGKKPYPVLFVGGEFGSAKSGACAFLRRIFDPNAVDLDGMPQNARELAINARNSFVLGYDNLSFVPDWFSDAMCRLATGSGLRPRALYTDSEEMLFKAARPIIVNGITDLVRRGDLLDRALLVNLEQVEKRMPESVVDPLFERLRPEMLGALANAVVQALREPVVIEGDRLPRMADYIITVESAAPALGWEPGKYLATYNEMRGESSDALLEGEPVAASLRQLKCETGEDSKWEGTAETLLTRLRIVAGLEEGNKLPANPRALTSKLKQLVPMLRRDGIEIQLPKKAERVDGRVLRRVVITWRRAQGVIPGVGR